MRILIIVIVTFLDEEHNTADIRIGYKLPTEKILVN